ncbi:MAG: hypothetical protein O7F71_04660 [Gammaproteobacteria bacterium]|nr:hypothetical protein [Gammaproteobacteria bacterium]
MTFVAMLLALLASADDGTAAGAANSPVYVPADLLSSSRPLSSFISHPKTRATWDRFIRCETYIDKSGRYRRTYCPFADPEARLYGRAIVRKLAKARATPAYVDGRRVKVWLQFAVLFGSDGKEIVVVPNHNRDVISFGANYQAPQRYTRPEGCGHTKYSIFLRYTVSESGEIIGATASSKSQNLEQIERVRSCLMRAKYIPARMNLEAIEATVEEEYQPYRAAGFGTRRLDDLFWDRQSRGIPGL